MNRTLLIGALATALGFTTAAQADWQYTRWGMTVDEVVAAGAGQVTQGFDAGSSSENQKTLASAPYNAGGRAYTAKFAFDLDGKLMEVNLHPVDVAECDDLFHDLRAAYGEPPKPPSPGGFLFIVKWQDTERRNDVAYLAIPDMLNASSCRASYQDLPTKSQTGL